MIQAFIGQQYNYTIETVKALGILLGIAVQVRRDHCALAEATIAAAQKAMKQNQEADTKFAIGVGASLVNVLVGAVSGGSLLTLSVGACITASGMAVQRSVDGDKSEEIVGSYNGARRELLRNYKDSINSAKNKITEAQSALSAEKNELFAPIPPSIDVNTPNFRYQDFSSVERELGQFGGKVEQEHKKLIAEQHPGGFVNPDSPIQQRLEG